MSSEKCSPVAVAGNGTRPCRALRGRSRWRAQREPVAVRRNIPPASIRPLMDRKRLP